jgi:homoserine O-acetyltransferase
MRALIFLLLLLSPACASAQAKPAPASPAAQNPVQEGDLQIAELGRCELEGGGAIEPCRVGYRTFGVLDAGRTNAVLVPTEFIGTTEQLLASVGPGKLLDPSEHFIVLVDAFGNGVSSSPSNSPAQPGEHFPPFTIRDLVRAQHRLASEVLGLGTLRAVVGTSMGGMQALEWAVSYPQAVEKAVAIAGSPRLSAYDLLLWETMLRAVEASQACDACDPVAVYAPLAFLVLQTPERFVRQTPREEFNAFLRTTKDAFRPEFRPEDVKSQLRAMMAHDVAAPFGGSLERAAARVQAELLAIVAPRDHIVRPEPMIEFAQLLGAPVVVIESDCGHQMPRCERERVAAEVRAFLRR